ncbi:hypothetical protein NMY22_g5298 [Coprinellus aureogranulatus]|nr:hypothetical protein NMY22_g5298 [Coprinellus aureogranulatus]
MLSIVPRSEHLSINPTQLIASASPQSNPPRLDNGLEDVYRPRRVFEDGTLPAAGSMRREEGESRIRVDE